MFGGCFQWQPLLSLSYTCGRCVTIASNSKSNELEINEQIRDKEIRLIGADGAQMGIMSPRDALKMAIDKDLDLVKVAPQAKPPVCKILDYGKYRFEMQKKEKEDPDFVREHLADLCASVQGTIVDILVSKLLRAVRQTGIREAAIAGGVSANSGLREALQQAASRQGIVLHLPALKFTTDNAAMIAVTGYFKYLRGQFTDESAVAQARYSL